MTKKHEELVEEITEIWRPWGGPGGYYPDWVKAQRAKATIALILSAFRDGRLDEELGVVGRCTRAHIVEFGPEFADWIDHVINFHGARTFIALRPLKGTGKEE